jgi:alpha-N-arabinofuranosidase
MITTARRITVNTMIALQICLGSVAYVFPQAPQKASITIDTGKVENRISPLLYGQFLEYMFEGVKYGLHAELLRDRSFEESPNAIGLPRYWARYPDDRADDYALTFNWDPEIFYPAKRKLEINSQEKPTAEHSLQVDTGEGVITRHGLYQSDIPIHAGFSYPGYIWLKSENYTGSVNVALESAARPGLVYASTVIKDIKAEWQKYEFSLQPAESDQLARFAILFSGKGRVWVDQVSLIPGDAAPGEVRRDVFERIKELKPAYIRWPGGNVAQDYRWLWGVGARDERVTWMNLSWRNEPEPSDFGTDEFISFARAVGSEPSITVNVEGRGATVNEAAAWVEYCNSPVNSKYGALRAANGHRDPYNVKLWEIGNEIWGNWVRGHSDSETYARNLNRYAAAMRAIDPSIKLIAVGDNDLNWNRTVLKLAGPNIDYLAIHHYYGRNEMAGDAMNLMARPLYYERFYQQVGRLIAEVGAAKVKLAINEWGLDLPEARQYSMESALYAARLLNVFERSGNLIGMSAVSDLVNGWPGGIIQAGRHGVFVSPIFLVNQLYAKNVGTERLAALVTSPTFDTSREGKAVPYLDVAVSRLADGRKIFVKAVNTNQISPLVTSIRVQGATTAPRAEMLSVNAPSIHDANSFTNPNAVSIGRTQLQTSRDFIVTLAPHSVSVIVLDLLRR